MASKSQDKKSTSPTSAESMQTRFKAFQQKRQLRNIDRSMKNITQLLKSPTKSTSPPGKPKTSPVARPTNVQTKNSMPGKLKLKAVTLSKSDAQAKTSRMNTLKFLNSIGTSCVIKKRKPTKPIKTAELSDSKVNSDEYYPNKLKRHISAEKIKLKPKHQLKLVAAQNKRKRGVPRKGESGIKKCMVQSDFRRQFHLQSPVFNELSIAELVRLSDSKPLTDEDMMEILTCPSPVWWEDPSDAYFEQDAVNKVKSPIEYNCETIEIAEVDETEGDGNKKETQEIKQAISGVEIAVKVNKDTKYQEKRNKLENLLGNLKTKNIRSTESVCDRVSENCEGNTRKRKDSTDFDDRLSDTSLNEEEILKGLENMVLPVQRTYATLQEAEITVIDKQVSEKCTSSVPNNMPRLQERPKMLKRESPKGKTNVSDSSHYSPKKPEIDSISDTNIQFLDEDDSKKEADTDICEVNKSVVKTEDANCSKKVANNKSEFITVYKILSNDEENSRKSNNDAKQTVVNEKKNDDNSIFRIPKSVNRNSKMNLFFKNCKNRTRQVKSNKTQNGGNKVYKIDAAISRREKLDEANKKLNDALENTINTFKNKLEMRDHLKSNCKEKVLNKLVDGPLQKIGKT